MNLIEFEKRFSKLPNLKTGTIDKFNKELIKEKANVDYLKDLVISNNAYHRTYFQVSLMQLDDNIKKYDFIEKNAHLLKDWWHVDQLTQFLKNVDIDFNYERSMKYIDSDMTFLRRWGYVSYIPTLVKNPRSFEMIISLLKDDNEYYVQMAEAWLICEIMIYYPEKTLLYLKNTDLKYNIIGKAIQKICDSFRISEEYKNLVKEIRKKYK